MLKLKILACYIPLMTILYAVSRVLQLISLAWIRTEYSVSKCSKTNLQPFSDNAALQSTNKTVHSKSHTHRSCVNSLQIPYWAFVNLRVKQYSQNQRQLVK